MARGHHLIGKVLGACTLEKLLGYGGSSAVFLAQQQIPERKVAVKVFLPRPLMDVQTRQEFYLRFLSEAEAASKLDHPHILPIYSYGEEDGLPYIVMPYMEGGTLAEYMARRGPLSLEEALWYLEQISSALDYAHKQGCVHCDVKPANILLDAEGYALLSDFGIARAIHSESDITEPAGRAHEAVMGTPDYISPEQALGQPIDGRSDIYSLGIMLFYLLTKRLPFRADTSIALALLHVHELPPSLTEVRADIPRSIDNVILHALAKNPDARFQSAVQFKDAFARAVLAATSTVPMGYSIQQALTTPYGFLGWRAPLRIFRFSVPRFVVVLVFSLLLIGVVFFSADYISSSFWGDMPRMPQVTTSDAHNATIDYLTNHDNWPLSSTFFYDTQQQNYHILNNSAKNVALALYSGSVFTNFRLSVTMAEVRGLHDGADYYGVVFRCSADQSHYYLFEVVTSKDAQYDFLRYDQGQWKHLAGGHLATLLNDGDGNNTVSIEAHNNTFTFTVNGKKAGAAITDSSAASIRAGQVGLYVEAQGDEVAFSHLYINSLNP